MQPVCEVPLHALHEHAGMAAVTNGMAPPCSCTAWSACLDVRLNAAPAHHLDGPWQRTVRVTVEVSTAVRPSTSMVCTSGHTVPALQAVLLPMGLPAKVTCSDPAPDVCAAQPPSQDAVGGWWSWNSRTSAKHVLRLHRQGQPQPGRPAGTQGLKGCWNACRAAHWGKTLAALLVQPWGTIASPLSPHIPTPRLR